ncbi:MAG: dCTP deaminase [Verrucomicrobia bacterium GWF2_51_19]|nr:MAG: dCTP deaminase [Verrucomicrobia bacterium GWF2_51_19]HCJ11806.1 dCTP deaminase [Opitutae bacterium]
MILTGDAIRREVETGRIFIDPFNPEQLNPNSYDFRLGKTLKVYEDLVLDAKKRNQVKTIMIPPEGIVLHPHTLYLGHTAEIMGSEHYVPIIRGKSSTGRLGLFINITADLIDIGSINQWTLQLHAVQSMIIYPNMRIGQVTFWAVKGTVKLYNGKYQHSRGPMESQSYMDFTGP